MHERLDRITKRAKGAQSNGEGDVEVRYFESSRPAKVGEFVMSVRSHWSVGSMHWVLDVVFHDEATEAGHLEMKPEAEAKKAGWNTEFLE